MYVIVSVVTLAVVVIALVDIITRPEGDTKHLPKIVWVLLVVFLPLIGSILWFAIGREYNTRPHDPVSFGDPRRWAGRQPTSPRADASSRSTEQQLADLDAEIEYYKQRGSSGPKES
ncbi:PLD nuclease N-terminal domain-containing protein [Herbiconiux sp. YIM B11900]|uniref:PLD nuclease N-terminal domain-containing protein n=1 Tax=Herbiconiux sp. YIM B11900 TaxID=3404131 RepID=UPI003F837FE8